MLVDEGSGNTYLTLLRVGERIVPGECFCLQTAMPNPALPLRCATQRDSPVVCPDFLDRQVISVNPFHERHF